MKTRENTIMGNNLKLMNEEIKKLKCKIDELKS